MQNGSKAYIWTFIADRLVGYRFSPNRSGETPLQILGSTQGTLVVDMFTGYNRVTQPGGRERAGCMAHARRKFFEALEKVAGLSDEKTWKLAGLDKVWPAGSVIATCCLSVLLLRP